MDIIKILISWSHTTSAFLSLFLGVFVLFATKGNEKHRKIGIYYFYLMLINNFTALFIYNSFGKWFFPHSLAVATLIILIPGYLITLKKEYKHWLKIHITSFVISYYLLIGGAINEVFLRYKPLMMYKVGSPQNGMTQFAAMVLFTIILIYFLFKYRRKSFNLKNEKN